MVDAHRNFAGSLVATAPSPATSGTSLVVTTGDGTKFPAPPFNATIWPAGATPTTANAEIVRVTAVSTDTLTITRTQESTSARTVVIGDQIVAGITAKTLTDVESAFYPSLYLAPAGATYQTVPREFVTGTLSLASGVLSLVAISLPAGFSVGHIAFMSGGAGAGTPTHWWFGLYDSSRVQLATTADQTTTAWAGLTLKSLAVATIASGSASSFTTTYAGLHYVGIMMTASSTVGLQAASGLSATGPLSLAPALCGASDTAQTTPPAFAHTATTITQTSGHLWAYVGA